MADLHPVAGARIYIGPAIATKNADFVEGDFSTTEGDWKEIDGWENAGGYGDAAQLISKQLINRKRDLKTKGTRNAGQMANQFEEIIGDAGQLAAAAAEKTKSNYQIRIIYDDENPAAVTPTPTTHYFVALVMSWNVVNGPANNTRMREMTLELNSNVVEVPAAQA